MNPIIRAVSVLAVLALTLPLVGYEPLREKEKSEPESKPIPPKEKPAKPAAEAVVEVHFTDDSFMKVKLRDEKIELVTPYGKLLIPANEIRRIEFATRIPEDLAKRIDAAVISLGSNDFKTRETATAELTAAGIAAYPALLKAVTSSDAEVKKRAQELLDKLRGEVPEDRLEVRPFDVIHTAHSKIAGHVGASSLKVHTAQFGEQQMKLADARSLNVPGAGAETTSADSEATADSLHQLGGNIGKTYRIKVTGNVNGSVWGSDIYTTDSSLETAAVHAGALKSGQTGVVRVTIVAPPPFFGSSTRNGVTTMPYTAYPSAFKVQK
jgi:LCCL domain